MTLTMLPFEEVFRDASGGNVKTPQSEYLEDGAIPVVDQGQKLIAGYVNDRSRICNARPPVIVFGDHTRAIKYADFEFAMGADGTKVLVPKVEVDVKYLYFALCSLKIPSAGYSRHYKFLKEQRIPFPPLAEQKRIAGILDAADALRAKRRESIAQLDALLQSTYLEMFGDPVTNPKGWELIPFGELVYDFRNGISPSSKGKFDGEVLTLSAITAHDFDFSSKKPARFDRPPAQLQYISSDTFLICRGNGNIQLVGVGVFPDRDSTEVCFPDTVIAATIDFQRIIPSYLQILWRSRHVRIQIERDARTTNGTHKVNQRVLSKIWLPLPPYECQLVFEEAVDSIRKQIELHRGALFEVTKLFQSLQHRAFTGEL